MPREPRRSKGSNTNRSAQAEGRKAAAMAAGLVAARTRQ